MVIMVITLNIALATLCLGIALKLHRIQRALKRTTRWLTDAERNTDFALHSAPEFILLGQIGAQYSKRQMTGLNALQQQFVRLAALVQLLQWIGQRQLWPIPKPVTARKRQR
jgi:hypothetical protein